MKKSIFILSIFALLNSCSKTATSVIPTPKWSDYYIEATATCTNPIDIYTNNTTTKVGYVKFGFGDSFTPAANKWYKTTMETITLSGNIVPVYIKIGPNNSPVPSNSKIPGIGSKIVTDFKAYNSPCQ